MRRFIGLALAAALIGVMAAPAHAVPDGGSGGSGTYKGKGYIVTKVTKSSSGYRTITQYYTHDWDFAGCTFKPQVVVQWVIGKTTATSMYVSYVNVRIGNAPLPYNVTFAGFGLLNSNQQVYKSWIGPYPYHAGTPSWSRAFSVAKTIPLGTYPQLYFQVNLYDKGYPCSQGTSASDFYYLKVI